MTPIIKSEMNLYDTIPNKFVFRISLLQPKQLLTLAINLIIKLRNLSICLLSCTKLADLTTTTRVL